MRVQLKIMPPVSSAGLTSSLERRIRLALGRFEGVIRQTQVLLEQLAEPGGRCQCRCRIRVSPHNAREILIEVQDIDTESAVRRAVDRAAWFVREQMENRPHAY